VDGSLSCSGAKLLLEPGCPALYQWTRKNPRQATEAMNFGSAAHREVLGVGWPTAICPYDSYTTKAAREWKAEQVAAGVIPVTREQRERIVAMAAAIRTHPVASKLLAAEEVRVEHSFFWEDPATGITLRARFDSVLLHGRVVITDYKTAAHANPRDFAKQAANLRYHWQDVTYRQAVTHTLGDADPDFLFVVQEPEPPYLVGIYRVPAEAIMAAQDDLAEARRIYARCVAADEWPDWQYGQPVVTLDWPRWAR
jgi:hypothetical protein